MLRSLCNCVTTSAIGTKKTCHSGTLLSSREPFYRLIETPLCASLCVLWRKRMHSEERGNMGGNGCKRGREEKGKKEKSVSVVAQ